MENKFVYTEEVTGEIVNIPVSLLHHHHDNPRKSLGDLTELMESIKAKGVLQNLTVVPFWFQTTGMGCDDPKQQAEIGYLVVIGNRRLEAAKAAGLKTLPCVIAKMTHAEQVQTMLLENMQREDLTIYEQAQGFQMMMDFGDSIDAVAEKTGFSKSTIRRRLKIAELDGETLKNVSGRQASLMDYDMLSQIDDIDTRNKVLCEIGTNNFNREFQKALNAQNGKKRKLEWQKIFETFGMEEISYNDIWNEQYKSLGYLDGEPSNEKIAEYAKSHDKLYFAWGYNDTPYIRADKVMTEETEGAEREEQKRRDEERTRREQLSELSKSAFLLRFNFIKNYSHRDSKKNIEKISEWMCLREIVSMMSQGLFSGYSTVQASTDRFKELFDIQNNDDWTKVTEFIDKHPEKALLMNVYAQWCDSFNNNCVDWSGDYRENPKLKSLYQGLCVLGYEMSDEEKQMLNGTHPLYKKSEDKTIDTETDEIEEVIEDTEDDFDALLKKKLGEVLGK